MAVNPMLTAGANGIQQGLKGLENTAQDIAELNIDAAGERRESEQQGGSLPLSSTDKIDDMAQAMVDLKLYQRQVQASAKVVETADAVIGFLLDVKA